MKLVDLVFRRKKNALPLCERVAEPFAAYGLRCAELERKEAFAGSAIAAKKRGVGLGNELRNEPPARWNRLPVEA